MLLLRHLSEISGRADVSLKNVWYLYLSHLIQQIFSFMHYWKYSNVIVLLFRLFKGNKTVTFISLLLFSIKLINLIQKYSHLLSHMWIFALMVLLPIKLLVTCLEICLCLYLLRNMFNSKNIKQSMLLHHFQHKKQPN